MQTTIKALWNGELYPCETPMPNTPHTRELTNLIESLTKKLSDRLDDTEKDLFEKFTQAQDERFDVIMEQIFTEGFCLGAKIAAEALTK